MTWCLFVVKKAYWEILDFLFPEKCLSCKKKGLILCHTCILDLRHTDRETQSNITALYDYRDPIVKKVIWNLKYYNRSHLGKILGELLQESFMEDFSDIRSFTSGATIYVVPIPISAHRKRERGYNQAEKIAKGFCTVDTDGIFELKNNIISKKKDTIAQAKIKNRNQRIQNIRGAFLINENVDIAGRTIIVIDDVTTTGGTLKEAMNVLKKGGARKVYGFAVAH